MNNKLLKLLGLFILAIFILYLVFGRSKEHFTQKELINEWDYSLIHYINHDNGNRITDAIYNHFYDMFSKKKTCQSGFYDYRKMLDSLYRKEIVVDNFKGSGIPKDDVLNHEKAYTYFCKLFESAFKKGIQNIQVYPIRKNIFIKVLNSGVPTRFKNKYFRIADDTMFKTPDNVIVYPHADAIYNLFFEFTKRKSMCPSYNSYIEAINNVDKNLFVNKLSTADGYSAVNNYLMDRTTYYNYCKLTKGSNMGGLTYNTFVTDINHILMTKK